MKRTLSAALLCATTLLLTVPTLDASAGEPLTDTVSLNVRYNGEAERAGDTVTLGFLVTPDERRRVTILVKPARRSKFQPQVRLIAPDGATFDPTTDGGRVRSTAKVYNALLKRIPADKGGLWRIEITNAGTQGGAFQVNARGKDLNKLIDAGVIPLQGALDVPFMAGANTDVRVVASRGRGSTVTPRVQIFDPNGGPVAEGAFLGKTLERRGKTTLPKLRLPVFGQYTARFTGVDNLGGEMKYTIITKPSRIRGAVATADAGGGLTSELGLPSALDGSGSRTAGGAPSGLTYLWSQLSGEPVTLSDPTAQQPTFAAPEDKAELAFQLAVSDGSTTSRISTSIVAVSKRPIADAGRSQAAALSATVTLDGTGSNDPDGAALTYTWSQASGDADQVTLDDTTSATPSLDAPATDAILHFQLAVSNGAAESFSDETLVLVGNAGRSLADAGRDQFVTRMATVHLCGLSSLLSDEPGSPTVLGRLVWEQLSGPPVMLTAGNTPWPSFTAPRETADLTFRLSVDDDQQTQDTVSVRVRPLGSNRPPFPAVNGLQIVTPGNATLDASGTTDADNDSLTYRWIQVEGPTVLIADADAASTTAAIPAGDVAYSFAVQANDGLQYGPPEIVNVYNQDQTTTPIALTNANVTRAAGQAVGLSAQGSVRTDGSQDPLAFIWVQESGSDWFDVVAEDLGFDPSSATPVFTLPTDVSSLTPTRTLSFRVRATTGSAFSPAEIVTVRFTGLPLNGKPVVTGEASESDPVPGTVITLNGTVFDREGDDVTTRWIQTGGTLVSLSPSPTALAPTFITPPTGILTFQLTANDGFDDADRATVVVDVDEKPIASATVTPGAGLPGTLVTVDASASNDPDGNDITYNWNQTDGPDLTFDMTAESFQFTAPDERVAFTLEVHDGRQHSDIIDVIFSGSKPTPDAVPTASIKDAAYGTAAIRLDANPPEAGNFTYQWRQITQVGDPTVTLSTATSETARFDVPLPTSSPFGSSPGATFGVIVSDDETSSMEKTVRVTFFASLDSQSVAVDGNLGGRPTVYAIIGAYCTSSCHTTTSNTCPPSTNGNGYGMGTKTAFLNNSISQNACGAKKQRVSANSPTNSYLLDRLKGIGSSTMPPSGTLPTTAINIIEDWISQGATQTK